MTSHRFLVAPLLLAVLVLAAPAAAAPTLTGATAAPADVKAGAHSDFTVDFTIGDLGPATGGDDLKSLRLDLPAGLVGNPLAPGATCPKAQLEADACPAGTRVGTTTTVADVNVLLVPLNDQSIPGDIYNIPTTGNEAARLGIVLRPAAGLFPKVILESPVSLRSAGDGGLTSTVDNVPRTAATVGMDSDLLIKRMTLTLLGKLPSGKAFMTNPTSCGAAPTKITIGTYAGAAASTTATFTPTACDALPFAPKLSAVIGATRDEVRSGAHPAVTVTVTQAEGEANAKSVSVALPGVIGPAFAALGNPCPLATYLAGACAASTLLGSATAESPLLAKPLTGPVTLVLDPSSPIPQLRIALHGAFDVNLTGVVTLTGRLVNTFDGIFDVPLSKFVLALSAGATSPVQVSRDMCVPGRATLTGTFVAHSGKTATDSTTATLPGCDDIRPTTLRARFRKHALSLSAANADRPVQSLSFRLPKGLHFTKRAVKRTRVTTSAVGVPVKARISKGRLTVAVPGDGADKVQVTLRKGALRAGKRITRRLRVDVALVGVAAKHATVKLR